jgi:hypothetical protein
MMKLINSPSVFSPSSYSTPNSTSSVLTNGTSKSTGFVVNDPIILAIKAFKNVVCKSKIEFSTLWLDQESKPEKQSCEN